MGEFDASTVVALLRVGSLAGDNFEQALQEILRVASDVLRVERVSYWRHRDVPRDLPPAMVCELGYVASAKRFEWGFVLPELAAGTYFTELRKAPEMLAVEDARQDARTRELGPYLEARGIFSLLDAPVRLAGRLAGVLCVEHTGATRSWTSQDQELAFAVAQVIAARVDARSRSRAENREQQATFLNDVMATLAESLESGHVAQLAVERALPVLGEMAALYTLGGDVVKGDVAVAHVDEASRTLFEQVFRLYPPTPEGTGLIERALRESQSMFVPTLSREAARIYGVGDAQFELIESLRVRSVLVVPFNVRGQTRGVMLVASNTRSYEPEDLQFAELYAQRIGVVLENARLYREAQDAIAAREDFLSLASHDLHTPITSLRLSAHTLAQRASQISPETVANLGERILEQTARLERLAARLLETCKLSRQESIHPQPVDLCRLVQNVAHGFAGAAQRAGSMLLVSTCAEPLVGQFDPIRIERMISNLIDNAVKFGSKRPIQVHVRKGDDVAVISVKDEGMGIAKEEQRGLFKRYARTTSAQGVGGLGLGLHLVKEIVNAHGGTIRLESASGQGSTFIVELPIESTDAQQPSQPPHDSDR